MNSVQPSGKENSVSVIARDPAEQELIRRCIAEERTAQNELYKKFYGKMMAVAMRYTINKDEALDILNQSFLKVFNNLEQYQDQGSFEGWIRRIVVHTAIDHVRARLRYKENYVSDAADGLIETNVTHQLYAKDLMKMLMELPENIRTVFNLFAIEGYKHHEIASILNMSEGTSKWYVSEARRILKGKLLNHH